MSMEGGGCGFRAILTHSYPLETQLSGAVVQQGTEPQLEVFCSLEVHHGLNPGQLQLGTFPSQQGAEPEGLRCKYRTTPK